MTPSSTLLHFLAARGKQLGVTVMHPESEVAVANLAIGATYTGARAMLGTSGGGFGLMVEAFSLAGMSESPLLCVYAQRPGPSTGAATLHEQSDLGFAVSAGHGEFPRLVASPADMGEALLLASEMMELVWRFQTPGILLTEKHLAESSMSVDVDLSKAKWSEPLVHKDGEYKRYRITEDGVSPLLFPPSKELVKWSSHEHMESGLYSEKPEWLIAMHDKRRRKGEALVEHLKKMRTVNVTGSGEPLIITYGSTTMMVKEALAAGGLKATVVQPIYLEPFPAWEMERYRGAKPIVVEQSSTGVFAKYLREKAGIEARSVIPRYDGHPFDPEELAAKLREATP
jgi:2-oxoglutarate ferredoxin oxidoreductase subunit alpha